MMNKAIFMLLASALSMGFAMGPAAAFAANAPAKKPAVSKPAAKPDAHSMKGACEEAGMMGEYGYGMMGEHEGGMMGGHGHGMMMESPRMGMIRSLNLSDEQRSAINKLSDELKHKNWASMGEIMDESAKLRDLYEADKRDPGAIDKEYQIIFDLKRQMIGAMLTTQNQVEDLLTSEQLNQLKELRKKEPMHRHMMH